MCSSDLRDRRLPGRHPDGGPVALGRGHRAGQEHSGPVVPLRGGQGRGAQPGHARTADLPRHLEVYGSTETSGIAYRQQTKDGLAWTPFDNAKIWKGVHFFIGNHDLWTFGYLEQEIGLQVYKTPQIFDLLGLKFFIKIGRAHV